MLLAFALSMAVITVYTMTTERPSPVEETVAAESTAPAGTDAAAESQTAAGSGAASQAAVTPPDEASGTPSAQQAPGAFRELPVWRRTFEGEKFRAELTNRGGGLLHYALLEYEEWSPQGDVPVDLVNGENGQDVVGTGVFESLGLGDLSEAHFGIERESAYGVTFVLERGGLTVRKQWTFDPDGYDFDLAITIANNTGHVVHTRLPFSWPATARETPEYKSLALVARHDGTVDRVPIPSVGSSGFLGFGGHEPGPLNEADVEWFGVETQYFVGVLAPTRTSGIDVEFVPLEKGKHAAAVSRFAQALALPSGQSVTQEMRGFIGPKLDDELESFGANLVTSINRGYSWLAPLVRFFEWLLTVLYSIVPNYGVAIIILTILVRVATLPIVQRQMKSMEKMRLVQPRMKELQEKFADDRERLSQETLKLYKETGANPLSGCLPMLLQMPVFIGLFYALQSSIELRHAPFMLWMNDLSAPDMLFVIPGLEIPFRVLPVLMAASMVLQAKLAPTSPDPQQAQMMMTVMPIMMLVLFYQFPSGLVLYYTLSNFLGIAHQRWVGRNLQPAQE